MHVSNRIGAVFCFISVLSMAAVVVNGSVTMTGQLKYENQRIPLMKALRGVSGVKNIRDQVQAPPKIKPPGSGHGAG